MNADKDEYGSRELGWHPTNQFILCISASAFINIHRRFQIPSVFLGVLGVLGVLGGSSSPLEKNL